MNRKVILMQNNKRETKRIRFIDPITNKNVAIDIKREIIENASSYPVPLTYFFENQAIILYIDANFNVRGVETATFIDNQVQKTQKLEISTVKISDVEEEISSEKGEVIDKLSSEYVLQSIEKKIQENDVKQCLNFLIIGAERVGKTSLIYRYLFGFFKPSYIISDEVKKFKHKVDTLVGTEADVLFWDIPGQLNSDLLRGKFKGVIDGIICLFDVTNQDSFIALKETWIPLLKEEFDKQSTVYFANKIDQTDSRVIYKDQIQKLQNENDILIFETSVKDNFQIKETIDDLVLSTFLNSSSN